MEKKINIPNPIEPTEPTNNKNGKKYLLFPIISIVVLVLILIIPKPKKDNEKASMDIEKPPKTQTQTQAQAQKPQEPQPTPQPAIEPPSQALPLPETSQPQTTQPSKQSELTVKEETKKENKNVNVLAKNLNLRETPEGKIIEELKKGSQIEIIDTSSFPWIKVKHKDKEGYIYTCNIFDSGEKKEKEAVKKEHVIAKKEPVKKEPIKEKNKKAEIREEEDVKIDTQKLSIVCSKKSCVMYDKGIAYNIGDNWKGYVIKNINVFSIEVEKDGKTKIINLE